MEKYKNEVKILEKEVGFDLLDSSWDNEEFDDINYFGRIYGIETPTWLTFESNVYESNVYSVWENRVNTDGFGSKETELVFKTNNFDEVLQKIEELPKNQRNLQIWENEKRFVDELADGIIDVFSSLPKESGKLYVKTIAADLDQEFNEDFIDSFAQYWMGKCDCCGFDCEEYLSKLYGVEFAEDGTPYLDGVAWDMDEDTEGQRFMEMTNPDGSIKTVCELCYKKEFLNKELHLDEVGIDINKLVSNNAKTKNGYRDALISVTSEVSSTSNAELFKTPKIVQK